MIPRLSNGTHYMRPQAGAARLFVEMPGAAHAGELKLAATRTKPALRAGPAVVTAFVRVARPFTGRAWFEPIPVLRSLETLCVLYVLCRNSAAPIAGTARRRPGTPAAPNCYW